MLRKDILKKTLIVAGIVVAVTAAFLYPKNAFSYDTGAGSDGFNIEIEEGIPVHQYITREAINMWNDAPQDAQAEFNNYSTRYINDRIDFADFVNYDADENLLLGIKEDDLISGSAEEDYVKLFYQAGEDCTGDAINGFYEHFWDPDVPWDDGFNCGSIGGWYNSGLPDLFPDDPELGAYNNKYYDSAYRLAQYYWNQKAIPSYKAGDKRQAYYWLGRIAHLLQDMTVPAHAHNRYHIPFPKLLDFLDLYEDGPDLFENYASNVFSRYRGDLYLGQYYTYENLIENFQWSTVHDQFNPPNLFKLFWYTAQKTQYFATASEKGPGAHNWTNGNPDYALWAKKDEKPEFNPSLWNDENVTIISDPNLIYDPYQRIANLDHLSNALIPHAMKAVAGLYRLFWVETHVGNGAPDENVRQKFLEAYLGPDTMGFPVNDVHLWDSYWVQDFPDMPGFGYSIMIYNPELDKVFIVHGDIWKQVYEHMGGPNSWLGPPISNEEPYPVSDSPSNVIQRFKNGYITHLPGSSPYWKDYPNNITTTPQWVKTYGSSGDAVAYSIQQATDGGYIVGGKTIYSCRPGDYCGGTVDDIYVLRLDFQGNRVWDKMRNYQFAGGYTYSARQTADGGYIVAGYDFGYGYDKGSINVIKFDEYGNETWITAYAYGSSMVHSIEQTTDGGYILAGTSWFYGVGEGFYILKLDENGNKTWDKFYKKDWRPYKASSVQQTTDGGYIVAGVTIDNGGSVIYILKLDTNGNQIWDSDIFIGYCTQIDCGDRWIPYNGEYYPSIRQTKDGGYIVSGTARFNNDTQDDFYVIKLNAQGNWIWGKTYGGNDNDQAYSIQQTQDGGYIVAGGTSSFGAGGKDIYIVKLNAQGDMIWNTTYGGIGDEWAYSIQQTYDGGFIIGGATKPSGVIDYDFLVLKFDANYAPYPIDADNDGYTSDVDCNDNNPAVNHGATEINNDGIDNDCNPETPVASVSGVGMNTPASPKWRASMSVNVNGSGPSGTVNYYYTRQRVNFKSTSITSITASGSIATIAGVGNGTKIEGNTTTYCNGCTFTATIQDGSPDKMDMEIDGGSFYDAPGGLQSLDSGNFTVVGE